MKMTLIFCLLGIFSSASALASFLSTYIEHVDQSAHPGENIMVLATTEGRVLWADPADTLLIEALQMAQRDHRVVRFDYDHESGLIHGVEQLKTVWPWSRHRRRRAPTPPAPDYPTTPFRPTVFSSVPQVTSAFNSMDKNTKDDSQCFNRAHGWAFDLWRTQGIQSMKLFLFFTRRYIREYHYKWWFHVTPMTYVWENGQAMEYTLDRSFNSIPLYVPVWTNIFMKNHAPCRSTSSYSYYQANQNQEYCFLIRANMYYRSPRDLEVLENDGQEETTWHDWELRQARKQAFIHWDQYNP